MKKIINNFEDFINIDNLSYSTYKYISYDCLEFCSFVRYICIEYINGEINGFPLVFSDFNDIKKFLDDSYIIYALNFLDNVILEVIK